MDGKRIQNYWSNEMQAMLDTYKQFQILIPAENRNGAAHNGEDGRYVETLIREYLKRYLPKDLEVLSLHRFWKSSFWLSSQAAAV